MDERRLIMKHMILCALLFLISTSCTKQSQNPSDLSPQQGAVSVDTTQTNNDDALKLKCPSELKMTRAQKAQQLVRLSKEIRSTAGDDKKAFEKEFFCLFPQSFDEMNIYFGYGDSGPGLLYKTDSTDDDFGEPVGAAYLDGETVLTVDK